MSFFMDPCSKEQVKKMTDSQNVGITTWEGKKAMLKKVEMQEVRAGLLEKLKENTHRTLEVMLTHISSDEHFFIYTRYYVLGNLEAYKTTNGPFTSLQASMGLARDIFQAFSFLHYIGFAHQKICPKNIFIEERAGRTRYVLGNICLKKTVRTTYTNIYAAPEQIESIATIQSDVWAFGITILFMRVETSEFENIMVKGNRVKWAVDMKLFIHDLGLVKGMTDKERLLISKMVVENPSKRMINEKIEEFIFVSINDLGDDTSPVQMSSKSSMFNIVDILTNMKPPATLKEAIEPLKNFIPRIHKHYDIAVKQEPNDHRRAFTIYSIEETIALYRLLNQRLRNGSSSLQPFIPYLSFLLEAFRREKPYVRTVYRGMHDRTGAIVKYFNMIKDGEEFTFPAVTSCTEEMGVLNKSFVGSVGRRVIFVIENAKGVMMSDYSVLQKEKEVLLFALGRFRKISTFNSGDLTQIQVVMENYNVEVWPLGREDFLSQHQISNIRGHEHDPLVVLSARSNNLVALKSCATKENINEKSPSGWTALHQAAAKGHDECVEFLLGEGVQLGLDINARNKQGYTPLMLAICQKKEQAVMSLLKAKADVEAEMPAADSWMAVKGDRAVHLAAKSSNEYILKLLIGAEPLSLVTGELCMAKNKQNSDGYYALHCAVQSCRVKNMKHLLTFGADPSTGCGQSGLTPLHMAAAMECDNGEGDKEVLEIISLLMSSMGKCDPNLRSETDRTAMHSVIANTTLQTDTVLQALDMLKGTDLEARDSDGMTPLHLAALKGVKEVYDKLVTMGADTSAMLKFNGVKATAERIAQRMQKDKCGKS
eukprot:TRINITY_DN2588_c0_g1_i3.p1 TRINITY_DN2588_c0_g1~~TRINITY_DN2588_c0_g1_i3.p1  ORF type:complete len:839 (+),score=188.51 TRINITY_DN2588_c0_g1_i3:50-2518(+)